MLRRLLEGEGEPREGDRGLANGLGRDGNLHGLESRSVLARHLERRSHELPGLGAGALLQAAAIVSDAPQQSHGPVPNYPLLTAPLVAPLLHHR